MPKDLRHGHAAKISANAVVEDDLDEPRLRCLENSDYSRSVDSIDMRRCQTPSYTAMSAQRSIG